MKVVRSAEGLRAARGPLRACFCFAVKARENLAHVKDEVELKVQNIYDCLAGSIRCWNHKGSEH